MDQIKASEMTLRDHFAGLAMQGMIAEKMDSDEMAETAYEIADAMLEARQKQD